MKRFAIIFLYAIISNCLYSADLLWKIGNDTILIIDVSKYKFSIDLWFNPERNDTITFAFNTEYLKFDIDSFSDIIYNGQCKTVKLEKEKRAPLIVSFKNGWEDNFLVFDSVSRSERITIKYDFDTDHDLYRELKANYPIESIASEADDDIGKIRKISSWVQGLWEHNGSNRPKENNTLFILDEVKKGARFRCVEYGRVTTSCLNALGIPSRILALKTKYVETDPYAAGHVLMEAFLTDLDKWVMVDPQWDAIPHIDGYPLNAVELQQAITNKLDVDFWTNDADFDKKEYINWIYPYLYYFDIPFDNRENITYDERHKVAKRSNLMLVPIGAKNPRNTAWRNKMHYLYYTNSLADFYGSPFEEADI